MTVRLLFSVILWAIAGGPALAGLLVHLPYDGSAVNGGSTGEVNDGVFGGDAGLVAEGRLEGGVLLDGSGDFVDHGGSPLAGSEARTMTAWVKTGAGGLRSILTLGRNGNGTKFDFDIDGGGGGHLEVGIGSGRTNGAGSPGVNDGEWHLVAVTLPAGGDRDDLRFFIDGDFAGDSQGATNDPVATNGGGVFYVGSGANSAGFQSFSGTIDDIAIWDVVLGDDEIGMLYAVAGAGELEYDAGDFAALQEAHASGGEAVIDDELLWSFADGLAGGVGLSGSAPVFTLVFDAAAGTGLVSSVAPDPDSDGDGLLDAWERANFGDLDETGEGDPDGDGLSNEEEETRGTDPVAEDSDGDGLVDGVEVERGTDPSEADTDGDGLSDGVETGDGVFVSEEATGSDPLEEDTDGDGTPDGIEVDQGRSPLVAGDGVRRPNVIYILVDDLGYGDLGCFWQDAKSGTQKFDTPELDRMAAEGMKLTHHYVSAPVCAPSRASFLSGRHQGHANIRDSQFDKVLEDNHTVARMLKQAGYFTAHIGKNGVAGGEGAGTNPGHPNLRGFDYFLGYLYHGDGHEHYPRNGTTDKAAFVWENQSRITDALEDVYTTDLWTARAKKLIADETANHPERPFFLYLAYDTPHFKMQYPPAPYPAGKGSGGGLQWTGSPSYCNTATGEGINDYVHPDYAGTNWPTSNKQHAGMIRRIDNGVGDILQQLRDLGIADDTLVVFSSDNGPHNEGNNPRFFESYGPMDGIKRDLWEAGLRVPTIAWWPGKIGDNNAVTPAAESAYPSAIWDWMPTFADAAEVPAPAWCDGVSLLPDLTGQGDQRDKGYLYFEFNNGGSTPNWTQFESSRRGRARGQMQVVRVGDYSGIRTSIANENTDFEIYDVVGDPKQTVDLAGTSPFFDGVEAELKRLAVTSRRPGGGVGRPYDNALLPAVASEGGVGFGLRAQTYEGIWTWVPEFRDLEPVGQAVVGGLDLSVRPRATNYGVLYSGYLNAPADGNYTFHLRSDSGAQLFLHDAHVIDDDFGHSGAVQSGSVRLAAGLHPIRVYYRHGFGGEVLRLEWEGPGVGRAKVPGAVLFSEAGFDVSDLWLPFNEGEGNVASRATGEAVGAMLGFRDREAWVEGRHGMALQFDGTVTEVEVGGYTPPAGAESRTVAAWIRTTGTGAIVAWGNQSGNGRKLHFRIESAAANAGAIRVEVQGGAIVGTRDLRDGEWHHVAFVFENDGTPDVEDVRLFVDGVPELVASVTPQAVDTLLTPLTVGVDSQDRHFVGAIDEVRVFRTALSDGEIAALAGATSQVSEAWYISQFGGGEIDFGIDDDGDGADRIAEFAFGGDPFVADPEVVQPTLVVADGSLVLTVRRRMVGRHDLVYRVMGSVDLESWSEIGGTSELSAIAVGGGVEEVEIGLGEGGGAWRFVRFEAEPER